MRWTYVVTVLAAAATPLSVSSQAPEPMALGEVIGVVGADQEPESLVFGGFADVAVSSGGRLYVLDQYYRNLRAFDSSLQLRGTTGSAGRGPEEFGSDVLAMAAANETTVSIVDSGNMRLSRVSFDAEGAVNWQSTRLQSYPRDVCTLGDTAYVWTNTATDLVAVIDEHGEVLRTFAPREKARGELAVVLGDTDHFLNQGHLACDGGTQTVILAHDFHPAVRAFAPDGEFRWRIDLSDYNQQRFWRDSAGRCCGYLTPDPRLETFHVVVHAFATGDGLVVITLRESTEDTDDATFEARVLDASTGREVQRLNVPGLVVGLRKNVGYVAESAPYPRITMYRWPSLGY